MEHYMEIRLLPDPEFPPTVLMNALYGKLHRAFVELSSDRVGVSFPDVDEARPTLGERLRLHSNADDLEQLQALNWLTGMRDHIELSPITHVPANTKYCCVRRVQAKSSPERLRRRLMRRKGLDEQEARLRIPDSAANYLNLPFVTLNSQSTGQHFRLFIQHQSVQTEPVLGKFSTYGLSPTATVAWF